jgi:hypothetical protein
MRKRLLQMSAVAVIVAASGATPLADTIKLRSGQTVTGSFMSADVEIVRLLLDNGTVAEFRVEEISAVEFSPRKTPPPAPPDPAKAPAPVTIPAGTVLTVFLTQPIDVDDSCADDEARCATDCESLAL